jgi:hypothetical protein
MMPVGAITRVRMHGICEQEQTWPNFADIDLEWIKEGDGTSPTRITASCEHRSSACQLSHPSYVVKPQFGNEIRVRLLATLWIAIREAVDL